MSKSERLWSLPVAVHDIPESGRRYDAAADPNVRAGIAKLAGLRALPSLSVSFDVTRYGSQGLHVVGIITARVGQTCVVTLDPIESEVAENVDILFVPPPARTAQLHADAFDLSDTIERDAPEVLVNGTVDLGAIATEALLLGIDPYPRKAGVAFEPAASAGNAETEHPFAGLAALQAKKGANDG